MFGFGFFKCISVDNLLGVNTKILQFAEQLSSDSVKHVSTYVFSVPLTLVSAYMPCLCLLFNQDRMVAFCTEAVNAQFNRHTDNLCMFMPCLLIKMGCFV